MQRRCLRVLSLIILKLLKIKFMKTLTNRVYLLIAIMLFAGYTTIAQKATVNDNLKTTNETKMKTYLIQWIQSYVVGDKIFCVYKAENEDLLREHAKRGGFPVNAIYEVSSIISPATAK